MEEQNTKPKPIHIVRYMCPKCKNMIPGDLEMAQKHVNKPIIPPLPRGLVFKLKKDKKKYLIVVHQSSLTREHEYWHVLNIFKRKRKGVVRCKPPSKWPTPSSVYSSVFRKKLERGECFLLEKAEFENFKKSYFDRIKSPLEKLIRSNEELHKFLPREDLYN